jgi:ubiquinone/menaquinone biosynthesis C-methylase UbiE
VTTSDHARELWASGEYRRISDLIRAQARRLVEWSGIGPGDRVLDVAAGTGAASLAAAELGAQVTATDITPELVAVGEHSARERGLELEWAVADATALPFPGASYDVVMSAIGAMFAPDQHATADELVRVCRSGGTVAMANWTPGGGAAGRLSAAMAPFLPRPDPGPAPTDWGVPERVAALLGDRVEGLVTEPAVVEVDFEGGPDELAELYLSAFPPILAAVAAVPPDRRDDLTRAVRDGFRAEYAEFDGVRYDYLLVRATVR